MVETFEVYKGGTIENGDGWGQDFKERKQVVYTLGVFHTQESNKNLFFCSVNILMNFQPLVNWDLRCTGYIQGIGIAWYSLSRHLQIGAVPVLQVFKTC